MKASFSLSSLQASMETPDKGVKVRTSSSLTKKRHGEEYWRRSWGSTGGSTASDQKDEFWSALKANYDYIMDNQLIDNCKVSKKDYLGYFLNYTYAYLFNSKAVERDTFI